MSNERLGKKLLNDEGNTPEGMEIGSVYKHYKNPNNLYRLIAFGVLEATEEIQVIYEPLKDEGIYYIRPLKEWREEIVLNGQSVPRFQKIT